MITELKALEHSILNNIIVKGVRDIQKVSLREDSLNRYNPEKQFFEKRNDWYLETEGTNLIDVIRLNFVDPIHTISNDIHEVNSVLGIEATRQVLYNEIVDVLGQDTVNYRHVALLVDTMTSRGSLVPIDRHGINQGDIGPLAKSSFEETTDRLVKAGIFGERDKINKVSANIMLGQIPPGGTGDGDLILEESHLPAAAPVPVHEEFINIHDASTPTCEFEFEIDMEDVLNKDTYIQDFETVQPLSKVA